MKHSSLSEMQLTEGFFYVGHIESSYWLSAIGLKGWVWRDKSYRCGLDYKESTDFTLYNEAFFCSVSTDDDVEAACFTLGGADRFTPGGGCRGGGGVGSGKHGLLFSSQLTTEACSEWTQQGMETETISSGFRSTFKGILIWVTTCSAKKKLLVVPFEV